MNFTQVKWQSGIVDSLKKGLENNSLRHAFLFVGDTETSVSIANALANALLCEKKGSDACGICPSCKKTLAGSHPDKITVKKLTKKQSFGVDEVRDMTSSMYIKPYSSDEKIYIFDDASALTPPAQNALLKVIEEPPSYGRIILCAKKEEDLLPTVLSRIPHKYKLSSPTTDEIKSYLALKYPEKKQLASFCATYSEGNPSLAEALILEGGAYDKRKRLVIFLNQLTGNEKSVVFNFCGYLKDNSDEFQQISDFLFAILRDILFIKMNLSPVINSDLEDELTAISHSFSENAVNNAINGLTELCVAVKNYANFEGSSLKLLLKIWEDLHD